MVLIPRDFFYIISVERRNTMGIQQNMGEVIGLLKKERGKSLAEFATELEISRSTLQDRKSVV